jgi:hypothetical protein
MSFVKVSESGAYRAGWTEVHGTDFYDRSITFVPTATPGELTAVYTMVKVFLDNVWFHTCTSDSLILNLGVTEITTGLNVGEADPQIHGRQSGAAIPNDRCVVMHMDSEYRNKAWNTRLYRRGTAASLVDGMHLTKAGRSAFALVGEATVALFVDNIGESYHELVLIADGKDVFPDPDPGVLYCTPVAFIRIGGTLVKAPPFP